MHVPTNEVCFIETGLEQGDVSEPHGQKKCLSTESRQPGGSKTAIRTHRRITAIIRPQTKESFCNTNDFHRQHPYLLPDSAYRLCVPLSSADPSYMPVSTSFVIPSESNTREMSLILFNILNNYLCFAPGKTRRVERRSMFNEF